MHAWSRIRPSEAPDSAESIENSIISGRWTEWQRKRRKSFPCYSRGPQLTAEGQIPGGRSTHLLEVRQRKARMAQLVVPKKELRA